MNDKLTPRAKDAYARQARVHCHGCGIRLRASETGFCGECAPGGIIRGIAAAITGTNYMFCPDCDGHGTIRTEDVVAKCNKCSGTGRVVIACEGCDGSGIRANASPHAGEPPAGYSVIERCDVCCKYGSDYQAARAWGSDVDFQRGFGTRQVIARGKTVRPSDGMSIVGAGDEDPDDMRDYPGGDIADFMWLVKVCFVLVALAAMFLAALWLSVRS